MYFFFNDTATTEIYTLSLHDALPIYLRGSQCDPASTTFAALPTNNIFHLPLNPQTFEFLTQETQTPLWPRSNKLLMPHTDYSYLTQKNRTEPCKFKPTKTLLIHYDLFESPAKQTEHFFSWSLAPSKPSYSLSQHVKFTKRKTPNTQESRCSLNQSRATQKFFHCEYTVGHIARTCTAFTLNCL